MSTSTQIPTFGTQSKIKLPTTEFLDLLRSEDLSTFPPPHPVLIQDCLLKGQTDIDCVQFEAKYKILVLNNDWIKCPLIPATYPIQDTKVNRKEGFLGVFDDKHCIVTDVKGVYEIQIKFSVPYASKEKRSTKIQLCTKALRNQLNFEMNSEHVEIKVNPAFKTQVKREKEKTSVETVFPPTSELEIYWRKTDVQQQQQVKKVSEKRPRTITVEQNTLHSIGEGIVNISSEFKYTISNGTVNQLVINIDNISPKFRLLRVEGHSLKKWEFKRPKLNDTTSETSSTLDEGDQRILKAILETGVEGAYTLRILGEMDIEKSSCELIVPSFSAGPEVDREKGNIAIEATSSIEINEISSDRLDKVDPSELPSSLTSKATNHILHAYKFLSSGHTLKLDVKRHGDVPVLVAIIQEALYVAVVSEDNILHRVSCSVQNTNQDFLKIELPENSQIWSTLVSGKVVRPAIDKTKKILIPLKRSASKATFLVEIVFITPSIPMNESGKLELEFARFNTPIRHAFFEVFLPRNYRYGEFEGNVKEVYYFSQTPKVRELIEQHQPQRKRLEMQRNFAQERYSNISVLPQQQQMRQIPMQTPIQLQMNAMIPQVQQQVMRPIPQQQIIQQIPQQVMNARNFVSPPPPQMIEKKSGVEVGVMPVTVTNVKVGKCFLFEKLLLSEESEKIQLSVPFKKVHKPFSQKRHLFPYKTLFFGIGLLMMVCVFLVFYIDVGTFYHK